MEVEDGEGEGLGKKLCGGFASAFLFLKAPLSLTSFLVISF